MATSTHASQPAAPAVDPVPAVPAGDLLRRAREQQGLTIAQLSDLTKIPQRHLEAIESGNLSAVPGDFYRRAEIKTYARAVKVDPRLALASFARVFATSAVRTPASSAPKTKAVPAMPSLSPKSRAWVAFGVVSFAAALGFFMRGTGPSAFGRPASPASAAAVSTPAASATDGDQGQSPALVAVGTSQTDPAIVAAAPTHPAPDVAAAVAPQTTPEASAAAAPAALTTTTLVINTEPAGARVTVDGVGWGPAPVTIRHLESGEKRVRVSYEGFQTAERVLQLNDGQRRTLVIRLRER